MRGLAPGQRDLLGRARAVFPGAFLAEILSRQRATAGLPEICLRPEFRLFLAVPDLEGHGRPRLLPGNHALELLPRLHLVDQPGAVGGEVCPQKDSSRRKPVPDAQPRCISAGGSGVGARGVREQGVGKQSLGKGGLRKRCRIRCVEVVVKGKPVVREPVEWKSPIRELVLGKRDKRKTNAGRTDLGKHGSVQDVAMRRRAFQRQISDAFHEHSLPRGTDIKGSIVHQMWAGSESFFVRCFIPMGERK